MNKIVNLRYASEHQLPQKKSLPYHTKSTSKNRTERTSHVAAKLLQKQSQIDLVKKRISALCVRQQKYAHKAVNSDLQLQKKEEVQKESMRIARMLQRQKQKQKEQLEIVKHRNLKTRADNYYRVQMWRERREEEAKKQSAKVKSSSQENHSTISQNRTQTMRSKREKGKEIYQSEKRAQRQRNRVMSQKREDAINLEKRQTQHLKKIQSIKDFQLNQLSKLQLLMVEKSNTSRAAFEESRERLSSRTSKSRFQTHHIIRTARQRNSSRHNFSLNLY